MPLAVHLPASDGEHDRAASALADFGSSLSIRRKMHVMPLAFIQTGRANRFQKALGRAVVKQFRRSLRVVLQVYLDRMPLARADALAVLRKLKTLFVVGCHDVL